MSKKKRTPVNITNRKAYFEYSVLEEEDAGIVLQGIEIKSIIANQASLDEAYCFIDKGEVFLKNMHVAEPKNYNGFEDYNPIRLRKLLLTKKQINKFEKELKNKGITCVPLRLFTNDKGKIKIKIGLVKGKKIYDKRESIKAKDLKREADRQINNF